jgi:neutral ceramidase
MRIHSRGKKILGCLLICFGPLLFTSDSSLSQESGEPLRAGTARVDITPDVPVLLDGYEARKELSTGVHDHLYARAVAFEIGGEKLLLVSADLIGFCEGAFEFLQAEILKACQLTSSQLILAGIHTHSAPILSVNPQKGHPNNLKYTEALKPKLVNVAREALARMKPVRMGVGLGYCSVGMNRREMRPDGSIILGRNPYGPADHDVLVMKVADTSDRPMAVICDYATHATSLGPENLQISGDCLGLASQFVERILGAQAIAPVFAGASGDIDPWYRVLPGFNTEPGWIPEPELLGSLLGEEMVHVFRDIQKLDSGGQIKSTFATIELPGKKLGDTVAKPEDPPTRLNITAARIGDTAFIGFGCEMLTEVGMTIKAGSPFKHTFLITHCNGATDYLPPAHLYKEGGYEVRSSPFAPQAADLVIRQALRMLYQLE